MVLSAAAVQTASAQFAPILLNPSSYNQDMIVEKPNVVTTATMDNGTANTGATWYEMGYDASATGGITGLPHPGTTIVSSSAADHSYMFAPDYTTNCAILIDGTVTNCTITLTPSGAYSALSFLLASGNGAETIAYKVHHADASVDTGTITAKDWFFNSPVAFVANGRVDVTGRVPDNVNNGEPNLYPTDITLANTVSPVTSIDFSRSGSGGHGAILAISGSTGSGFNPIVFTGYNKDMIVEAAAQALPPNGLYTTASMDGGTANTGNSWYVKGFDTAAATTGLPAAGSTIASAAALDHQYIFAPNYSSNNVLMIDPSNSGSLIWATPTKHSALSFLVSAGHGPITVDYTVNHADTTTETGTVIVPDWFNNTPVAYNANGRTDVASGFFDSVNGANPRIYTVDISLNNSVSPVNSVVLSYDPGNANTGVAVFFAVSGTGGTISPVIAVQPYSTNAYFGSATAPSALVSGTAPLTNHWQKSTGGAFVNMSDAGEISGTGTTNLAFANLVFNDSADYQLVVANAAGSTTSSVAHVNVISTTPDVAAPSDTISIYNGASPGAETVPNAINDSTSKYLNYGVNNVGQSPPYVGPTGLIVTPSMGSTVVTSVRLYTANDAPERDPADFLLEGSNDGGSTYTTIASGPVALPTDRNAGGLALDPVNQPNREIHFVNHAAYTTYRWSVANVRNNFAANSMQIGEVELLGTTPPPQVTLTYTRISATQIQFFWSQGINLQSAPDINGTFTDIPGATTSGYTVTITPGRQFFRVRVQ